MSESGGWFKNYFVFYFIFIYFLIGISLVQAETGLAIVKPAVQNEMPNKARKIYFYSTILSWSQAGQSTQKNLRKFYANKQ